MSTSDTERAAPPIASPNEPPIAPPIASPNEPSIAPPKAPPNKPRNNLVRATWVQLAVSLFCIFMDELYASFSHGVRSAWMDFMFLYPFVGGMLVFLACRDFLPGLVRAPRFRLAFNLYNSGLATFTVGSMYTGIVVIAGTDSPLSKYFFIVGALFVLASLAALFLPSRR